MYIFKAKKNGMNIRIGEFMLKMYLSIWQDYVRYADNKSILYKE